MHFCNKYRTFNEHKQFSEAEVYSKCNTYEKQILSYQICVLSKPLSILKNCVLCYIKHES